MILYVTSELPRDSKKARTCLNGRSESRSMKIYDETRISLRKMVTVLALPASSINKDLMYIFDALKLRKMFL